LIVAVISLGKVKALKHFIYLGKQYLVSLSKGLYPDRD